MNERKKRNHGGVRNGAGCEAKQKGYKVGTDNP